MLTGFLLDYCVPGAGQVGHSERFKQIVQPCPGNALQPWPRYRPPSHQPHQLHRRERQVKVEPAATATLLGPL